MFSMVFAVISLNNMIRNSWLELSIYCPFYMIYPLIRQCVHARPTRRRISIERLKAYT